MSMERNFPRSLEPTSSPVPNLGWSPDRAWESSRPSSGGLAGYRLGARLDALGEIYEGQHPRLPCKLVIKLFGRLAGRSSAAIAAFSREAGRVSILRHPHIARVFDSGVFGDRTPFLAMEHLHGRTLEEHLTLRGPLPLTHLLPVLRGIVSALSAAHAVGVVHGEIRPDNVFLVDAVEREPGVVKLLDFGVSRLTWAESSDPRGISAEGVRYLAPEQLRGAFEDVDARADQYAVAALVCRMLHGTTSLPSRPGATRTVQTIEPRRRLDDPIMRRVAAVRDVLSRALSGNSADRYPSVTAFLQSFEEALASSEGIAPIPPVEPSLAPAGVGESAVDKSVEGSAERRDPRSHRDPTGRDGALTRRFFLEGDLQEKNKWKGSPLAQEGADAEPEIAFSSFDRVPRRRKPLVAVAMVAALLAGGLGAWRSGWQSPGSMWRDSRLGRTAYLLRAGLPGLGVATGGREVVVAGRVGPDVSPAESFSDGLRARAVAGMAAAADMGAVAGMGAAADMGAVAGGAAAADMGAVAGMAAAADMGAVAGMDDPRVQAPPTMQATAPVAASAVSLVAARSTELATGEVPAAATPAPAPTLLDTETSRANLPSIPPAGADDPAPSRQSSSPVAAVDRPRSRVADASRRRRSSALRGYVWSPSDSRLVPSSLVAPAPDTPAPPPVVVPPAAPAAPSAPSAPSD